MRSTRGAQDPQGVPWLHVLLWAMLEVLGWAVVAILGLWLMS